MREFAEWLYATPFSIFLQTTDNLLPAIQTVHILMIGIVYTSTLVITLRLFGRAWANDTLANTARRFMPWNWGGLVLLLATGILMIICEPIRELLNYSFWIKMVLVILVVGLATAFQLGVGRPLANGVSADGVARYRAPAVATMVLLTVIIVLGRWIAYSPSF
ncbi:DUF6644 family protein [Pelagibacterium halotolerans]|uniref:DUF6644 domain-containing protein n=1 Tax=Pelagibacterium halotolerans (strain DSM 22347 / JCM 15775 / CGMCC 1.7692 / B2) TaxID=1082931 RepID=G4R731_PELHB|nr:DUF6644 family protein [Pelagibacterium halotolerans]AEQ50185.1 hypothetical protein KKY_138 [Pelagibacterium halotolerans B2]QJR19809.1 hypothetical protein HKM20_16045 [Pelagibacterium halotolerans]SEA50046.1 hypothetical protein SAMN05428936_104220 [Pelagibacterium halotolerans]